MNVAVILAGGSGSRFSSELPKQFIRLAGHYIIEYTLKTFENNSNIDEICIVANKEYFDKYKKIVKDNGFKKVKKIISGGKERFDSSFNAVNEYKDIECNLIFHDGVRPFVNDRIINDTVMALKKYKAVDVAIPTADTIIKVENSFIEEILNREVLKRGQTPQAFNIKTITKAYEKFKKDENPPKFTDDCGIVKYYLNEKIYVVKGDEINIKITYPADLLFAEKIIQFRSLSYQGKLCDLSHKVVVVFGGSSGIGKEIVLLAKKKNAKVYSFSKSNGYNITNKDAIIKAFKYVLDKEKGIDYIINTVGVLIKKNLEDMDIEDIENQLNTNLKSSILIAKYAIPVLKKNSMILFFTSSSYTKGRASYSIYSATKAAIVNLTQALSEELIEKKIKVNCINPSRTLTPMRVKNFGKE
ncbi:MAG: bifunctional cytidylyltransferase/SDR family oxidoreductase, partial [Epsilonproteobacteria bacterium]|nr:bifunctional cytidylyltransferase/SDR family oxidoreductase [Campylobacterota bacterium]